jgi:hypothetical protein
MHDTYVQLRMPFLSDDSIAASLTEAVLMPRKRRDDEDDARWDGLYPRLRSKWIDRKHLERLEAEMLRQRVALPAPSATCRHCGATGQFIPDPDGRACLACGYVVYR